MVLQASVTMCTPVSFVVDFKKSGDMEMSGMKSKI